MTGIDFIRDLAVVLTVAGVVGWLCQRVGLSVIIGYLAAGIIIGPYTPPFAFVAELDRVHVLSQVGLVFLIFSIGLNLSFQRMQRLGMSVILATVIAALVVFHATRLLGLALGWNTTETLFAAAMLMVSSSAIISKVLEELNATHQRSGQMALGMTVLEDLVAVVMLTILSTLIQFGGTQPAPLVLTIGTLGSFVTFLLFVSLLFVPRLLLRLTRTAGTEVRTIIIIGLLLSLAWVAASAGYSLALGAFLLGVIVASTPHKPEIERVFEGLRDMFGAVFFVSMGMLFELRLLGDTWFLVILLTVFTIFCRTIACALGFILVGNSSRDATRAGLSLVALGEFSFIIAQMGVVAGVVPPAFYPLAVGVSLATTLTAPPMMRHSKGISDWLDARMPLFLREWIAFYHEWLKRMSKLRQRSLLWRLTGRRLIQTGVHIFFVSALLLFAGPLYEWLLARTGPSWIFANDARFLFWSAFGILVLAPLVAIWRNFDALAMIFAESATADSRRRRFLQPLLETAIKVVATAVLMAWLLALLPFNFSLAALAAICAFLVLLAAIFWRRLVYWHSRLEIELQTQLNAAFGTGGRGDLRLALREQTADWKLQADEIVLPDFTNAAGRTIGELELRKRHGCSVVSIDRQGYVMANPGADEALYPRDKLLVVGTQEQIAAVEKELNASKTAAEFQGLSELSIEVIAVPSDSIRGGTLVELDPIRNFSVQIAGIQRHGTRLLTPSGGDQVEPGDELLVLGTPACIQKLRDWFRQRS
jgi:monovalent cation:H+ antiporter-2, CPA2 family